MNADLEDLLDPVVELLTLLSRSREQLSGPEMERARALIGQFGSTGTDPRRFSRREVTGHVHLVPHNGPIVIGTLHDFGAGGLQVVARRLPETGTRALVHVVHPQGASRYSFPVRIAWTTGPGNTRAGLRFCGRPFRRDATRTVRVKALARAARELPTERARPIPVQKAAGSG